MTRTRKSSRENSGRVPKVLVKKARLKVSKRGDLVLKLNGWTVPYSLMTTAEILRCYPGDRLDLIAALRKAGFQLVYGGRKVKTQIFGPYPWKLWAVRNAKVLLRITNARELGKIHDGERLAAVAAYEKARKGPIDKRQKVKSPGEHKQRFTEGD